MEGKELIMLLHRDLTDKILSAFYEVYNILGYGFLERVYQNSMVIELMDRGLKIAEQNPCPVYYKGFLTGNYFSDILVNDLITLELKACQTLILAHELQLKNYLRATNLEVGLLLNFGPKPEFKRVIFSNSRKH